MVVLCCCVCWFDVWLRFAFRLKPEAFNELEKARLSLFCFMELIDRKSSLWLSPFEKRIIYSIKRDFDT